MSSKPRINIIADFDLTMDPYGKKFQILMGRGLLKKYISKYSFLCILLTRISNEGSFIDRYFLQKMNTSDHILRFQSKARRVYGSERLLS